MNQLWLDDLRPAPEGWFWAKSYEAGVEFLLNTEDVIDASLDHDLGYCNPDDPSRSDDDLDFSSPDHLPQWLYMYNKSSKTGYDFVRWMVDHNRWPSKSCAVHSANAPGAAAMVGLINRFGGYPSKTQFTNGHRKTWGVLFYGKNN